MAFLLSCLNGPGSTNDWLEWVEPSSTPAFNPNPAYNPMQLGIIKDSLKKWNASDEYSTVKDLLGRQPRWQLGSNDEWNYAPDSFQDEKEARKAGCRFDFVKSTQKRTALLKLTYIHQAWIFIYDEDSYGRFVKSAVIVPPTWFSYAAVTFVDVLGPKEPKFILIEHNGNTGTGYEEKIHWLVGWRNNAFRTAFRETVFMRRSKDGEDTRYRMNYRIEKDPEIHIEAQCNYDRVFVSSKPYDFHSSWRDWYFWNTNTFSFYDTNAISERIQLGAAAGVDLNFRLNLETNRLKILNLPPLPQKMSEMEARDFWKEMGM